MADSIVQSVIFSVMNFNIQDSTEWLKNHGFKSNKVDLTDNYIRYRQENPEKLKKQGYTTIKTKDLNNGIEFIIFYKETPNEGGAIAVKNIKSFVDESYNKKAKDKIDDYELDKSLSGDYAKVYYNPKTKHAVVVHRGTQGASDWLNNVAYVIGAYKLTNRYKTGKEIQQKAEKKYGKSNVSTLGHSQGAMIASEVGKKSKEIIKLNPAYKGEKEGKNEYTIRSKSDVVSGVKHFKPSDKTITIEADPKHRYNILNEHSSDILNRLDQEQMIGAGIQDGYLFKNREERLIGGNEYPDLVVYQIKDIIQQYLDSHPDISIKFKSKKRAELTKILDDWKIDPNDYVVVVKEGQFYKEPVKVSGAKTTIKQYNEQEQAEFLERLRNNPRYKNPLQALDVYTDREGKKNYMQIQNHQEKFIKQFIFSNLRGVIAFHGVGSGKTLSAVVSSYYYLKMYPNNKVIIISPSALIYNFINEMVKYGLDTKDNRYHFYTYDKYIRNPLIAKDALLIVDEAHNFRTQIIYEQVKDPETNQVIETIPVSNQRGAKTMKWGSRYCHKILLLTGTAFVNGLYDVENLLAMIDNRDPISPSTYSQVLTSAENISDYFSYRIHYYTTNEENVPEKDRNFPKKIEKYVPIQMSEEQEKKYEEYKRTGNPEGNLNNKPNAFYSAERWASNAIDKNKNPKVEEIMKLIEGKPNQKFIVYSALFDAGINLLTSRLKSAGIEYTRISGRDSANAKEKAKKYYNGYNFGNPDFFDKSKIDESEQKYINDKYRVLVITRAGAEGVDTINTNNIILMDSQWNDALSEQIIARAIRFKSHFGLPVKDRYVNVYRLLFCNKISMPMAEKISEPNFKDWIRLNHEINEATIEKMKQYKIENEDYLPKIKELQLLVKPTYNKFKKGKTVENRFKSFEYFISPEEWTEYKNIGKIGANKTKLKRNEEQKEEDDDSRKRWRINHMVDWQKQYGESMKFYSKDVLEMFNVEFQKSDDPIIQMTNQYNSYLKVSDEISEKIREYLKEQKSKGEVHGFSIDLKMLLMSKSKGENIREFIDRFGKDISMFEAYQSKLLPYIIEEEKRLKRVLTDEEQAEIYAKLLAKENVEILRTRDLYVDKPRKGRDTQAELQQYFTSDALAKYIMKQTDIETKEGKIEVLEPTAGHGALIKPILALQKDITIDLIELDNENRLEIIKNFKLDSKTHRSNSVALLASRNFLKAMASKRYDYIFMNPPFHLRRTENASLKHDVYDIDFVKRAFAFLKIGGSLVAITSRGWINTERQKWTERDDNKIFTYEIIGKGKGKKKDDEEPDEKGVKRKNFTKFSGGVDIEICVITITKLSEVEDDDILNYDYYNDKAKEAGKEVLENERQLDNFVPVPPIIPSNNPEPPPKYEPSPSTTPEPEPEPKPEPEKPKPEEIDVEKITQSIKDLIEETRAIITRMRKEPHSQRKISLKLWEGKWDTILEFSKIIKDKSGFVSFVVVPEAQKQQKEMSKLPAPPPEPEPEPNSELIDTIKRYINEGEAYIKMMKADKAHLEIHKKNWDKTWERIDEIIDNVKDEVFHGFVRHSLRLQEAEIKKLKEENKPASKPKPEKPKPTPKKEEEIQIPEPEPAPKDIEKVAISLEKKIKEFEEVGEKNRVVVYNPDGFVQGVAYVALLIEYESKCVLLKENLGATFTINSKPKSPMNFELFNKAEEISKDILSCIKRGDKLIAMPLTLLFGTSHSGHANMLIYRPFNHTIERYEPHGVKFGNSDKDDESFNKTLKRMFEVEMKPYLKDLTPKFITPDEVCPMNKGFQELEEQIKKLKQEGGGFCGMWSLFVLEMMFINPTKTTKEIINEALNITKSDPQRLALIIRGYVIKIEKLVDTYLKRIDANDGFNFDESAKLWNKKEQIQNNLLSMLVNIDPEHSTAKVLDERKKQRDEEEDEYKDIITFLKTKTTLEMNKMYEVLTRGRFSAKTLKSMSQDQMIKYVIKDMKLGKLDEKRIYNYFGVKTGKGRGRYCDCPKPYVGKGRCGKIPF
jgi:predicted RNA methylase